MSNLQHVYVTFGGTLPESEIWQCGIRGTMGTPGSAPTNAQLATYVSEAHTAIGTWFSSATARHSSAAHLAWLKAALIGTDGKYPATSVPGRYDWTTPVAGQSAVSGPSGLTMLAVSFTTAQARGRASHGRIYPPNIVTPLNTYGLSVATTTQTDLVTATKALLTAVANGFGTVAFSPCVVSMGPGATSSDYSPIGGVRVGSVIDTVRRRKSAVRESYQASVWP